MLWPTLVVPEHSASAALAFEVHAASSIESPRGACKIITGLRGAEFIPWKSYLTSLS